MPGRRRAVFTAVTVGLALAFTPIAASADPPPGPTAGQVAASKAAVAQREQDVASAAAALGSAQARFERLSNAAEVVVEKYDEAQVKLAAAQRAADTAQRVLAAATRQANKAQRDASRLALTEYESGGISAINAFLAPGGPKALIRRVGALDAISVSQHRTLTKLNATAAYRAAVAHQADRVAATAKSAAAAAAKAKAAAESAALQQQKVLNGLKSKQAHFDELLAQAKAKSSRLQRERIEALARQRAAAAAAESEPPASGPSPYANTTGNLNGTVSASTAAAAVREAESQIGKPYQWGAAGPDTYDCSGLTMWSYAQVGVHMDHWTGYQWNEGGHVAKSDLRAGDLVFFAYNTSDPNTIHHVGMYIGNGQMVEAPYTGANVRISSAFRSDYIGAVRP
ncbi:MAG TPA: NlpC/P60 family protein, partial [Mycobacteriales bacterium]|nr:NlpC/P60 family protein [Mycobacteriales bacterium]